MSKRTKWIVMILFDIVVLIYIGGSAFFANVMINNDTQTLADSEARMIEREVFRADLPEPEWVTIKSGEVTLTGNFYDNELDGNCAVLLLHGYTSTRYGTMQYTPLFWDRGCDLLMYDARGHGNSSVTLHTYGYYEKQDGATAYTWLLERTGLPATQVGITGISYGAATSLQMLPLVPDAAFVIADSAYQDLRTIITRQAVAQFGSWTSLFVPGAFLIAELRGDFDADEVSAIEAVKGSDGPVFLVHALADEFTPSTHSEAIFANSNLDTTELHLTAFGTGHGRSIIDDYATYDTLVDDFLVKYAPEFGLR